MRKNYIIKDARRILAEQIRDNGMNTMNKNPITNATGLSAIIPKDNDGYCTVYKMDCEDGLGLMTVYQVYPGIQLIYNDFEATSCYWDGTIDKNVLEINHCREGREGSVLQSGSCLYLGEGDLSIHTMDNCASEMAFPLRHYRGISVVLDLELVSQNPPGILAESGIGIADFKNKFCADGACFVMRAKDEIEHIFSELYSVPDRLQKPYFMLKVQELLLFLCMVDVNKEKQRELYTSPQVEIVRDIHKRLISNLQERPTIEEISKEAPRTSSEENHSVISTSITLTCSTLRVTPFSPAITLPVAKGFSFNTSATVRAISHPLLSCYTSAGVRVTTSRKVSWTI